MSARKTICDAVAIDKMISRLAYQIMEKRRKVDDLALIGIHTRGVYLARRIRERIYQIEAVQVLSGDMDINLYRDDWTRISHHPEVRSTRINFDVDNREIILADDVLYTGRTIRAAMDALIDFGRPRRIELAVLIERGHRELPIQADYVGRHIRTDKTDVVNVLLTEQDGVDRVDLLSV